MRLAHVPVVGVVTSAPLAVANHLPVNPNGHGECLGSSVKTTRDFRVRVWWDINPSIRMRGKPQGLSAKAKLRRNLLPKFDPARRAR